MLTAIGLLLLLGACGKSAQVPLQSWLGDAMDGPTPVSALIHAATMVTAGVYLIVPLQRDLRRCRPTRRSPSSIVGAVTLLFGAIIGCAKDDIKKALAGSTMSQIGYMMLAAGLGPAGYAFAIAHLLAHGFFKADMFLGAGSVMHGMNDEVDMRKYGGLRTVMPITFVHVRARLPRDHRHPAVLRLLHQGQDHRGRVRQGRHRGLVLGAARAARRGHHRVLHVAHDVHDVLRREALGRGRAPARVAAGHDVAADHAGGRLVGHRRRS